MQDLQSDFRVVSAYLVRACPKNYTPVPNHLLSSRQVSFQKELSPLLWHCELHILNNKVWYMNYKYVSYLCFIPGSDALIASTIVLTDQLFIITAGSEN